MDPVQMFSDPTEETPASPVPALGGEPEPSQHQGASASGRATSPRLRLVAPTLPAAREPALLLDDWRDVRAAVAAGGPHRVLGAAGTGKTSLLVTLAADAIRRGIQASQILLLAPTRPAAHRLRDQLITQIGWHVPALPRTQSVHGYAFGVLRRAAHAEGSPPPRLLDAPEQDLILAELLAGHAAGEGRAVVWPPEVAGAVGTRGFRSGLLDLFTRATERGMGPAELARAGRDWDEPVWVAAAGVFEEYQQVTALRSPGAYDPATLVTTAASLLHADTRLVLDERAHTRLVLVDDYQDMGPAVQRLLTALIGPGGPVVVAGDPDGGVAGFRGGDPGLLREFPTQFTSLTGGVAPTHLLTRAWRLRPGLRPVARRVAAHLPGRGRTRTAWADPPARGTDTASTDGHVDVRVLGSQAALASDIVGRLRAAHVREGLSWSQMAVIARTTEQLTSLQRALTSAGVPCTLPVQRAPLREAPAVAPLLAAMAHSLSAAPLVPSEVIGLLTSPLGGATSLTIRQLRQALLSADRRAGGQTGSDELLVAAVEDPHRCDTLPAALAEPVRRVARLLAAGRRAAACADADAQSVLWAVWQATGLESEWRALALAGGPAGQRADRDLDDVLALMDAAARFVTRLPAASAHQFLDHVAGAGLPADPPHHRADITPAVTLLTPHAAVGSQWELVVITGLQDGVWPDLRPRGSLLATERLDEVLAGLAAIPSDARRLRWVEELRLLYVALTRARRQLCVRVVQGEDDWPSEFFDLLASDGPSQAAGGGAPGRAGPGDDPQGALALPAGPVDLAALVAELRAVVCAPADPHGWPADPAVSGQRQLPTTSGEATMGSGSMPAVHPQARFEAARLLAELAHAGVPGADPGDWHGLAPLSDEAPLVGPDRPVTVSPSQLESFTRCPLRWLLETAGGTSGERGQAQLGSLVHAVAAAHPGGDRASVQAELDRLWPQLGLPDTWVTRALRHRANRMIDKLADYYEQAAREGRHVLATEASFTVTLDTAGNSRPPRPVTLSGRVDRLEQDAQGRLVVVDLKTGRTKPRADEVAKHAQLGVYQVAVAEGGFPTQGVSDAQPGGALLVPLGVDTVGLKPQPQPPLALSADPDWAYELLALAAEGMAGNVFPATSNDLCRHCPVRDICPLQQNGGGGIG